MAERPEDLSLPASVVARIIKDALPDGVNVSKEARTAIGKAASVFILYTTACANNFALKNKRKTLSGGDVFCALQDMEYEEFIPELKDCLEVYKQEQRGRKEAAADRKKRVQLSSTSASSEITRAATDVAMDTAPPAIANEDRPLNAWKVALLERKKKQEEEAQAKEAQAQEAKLASLPPWKRAIALRAKNGLPTTPQDSPARSLPLPPNKTSDKWQVAVERVKGPDSPILSQKPKRTDATSSPKPAAKGFATSTKLAPKVSVFANSPLKVSATSSSPKLTPKVFASAVTKTENQVTQRWKPSSASGSAAKPVVKANLPAASPSSPADDPSLAAMPAWKRALILKKRNQQEPANREDEKVTSKQNGGEDEPDSAAPPSTQASSIGTPSAIKAQQPQVVNRRDAEDDTPSRLVEQEGKTLRAPVYKEVDEWADVKEEDDKFQSLPRWKQALIKRRRADIAKRSGLPVPEASTPPASKDVSSPLTKNTQNNKTINDHTSKSPRETTNEQKKKTGVRKPNNRSKSVTPANTRNVKPVRKAPVIDKTEEFKPARKAPRPPSTKKDKDPMFTYNFSKSTRHKLDTGGTSSDSTDSELEDAVVTNLDESSDEGDSGIVLQHYSGSKTSSSSPTVGQKSPSLGQKSHSDTYVGAPPALSVTGKKKRKMRRVSWSDTQLVLEHFYPKYDYSDYDNIEQEMNNNSSKPPSTENSGLSHRLHPSLRPNNESDPYGYGFSSAGSPRSPSAENSLSTFVPKALSAYSQSPQTLNYSDHNEVVANDNSRTLEEVTTEEETDDFYADLTSNTAALLW